MNAPYPRLVIEVIGGTVAAVYADGIDLSHLPAIVIDHDCEGEEDTVPYGIAEVRCEPMDIEPADEETSRNTRQAYDNWALS